MPPAAIITLVQLVFTYAPQVAQEIKLLLQKGDPTPEDWEALRVKVSKSYDDYINEAKGTVTTPPPEPPPTVTA